MKTTVVVDINSGSVGAGVVLGTAETSPRLSYSYRRRAMPSNMLRVLAEVLEKVFKKGLVGKEKGSKQIDHILVTFSSVYGTDIFDDVENVILNVFGSKRGICVKDFSNVLAHGLPVISREPRTSLLFSTSGEYTEVLIVGEAGKNKAGVIHFGPKTLVNQIARITGKTEEISESLLIAYSRGILLNNGLDQVQRIIHEEEDRWNRELSSILKNRSGVMRIYFSSDSKYNEYIESFLEKIFPEVDIISIHDHRLFSRQVTLDKHVSKDESLMALALLSNSLL
ncbi:MAG: hypothetical protein ABIF06_01185 [bacterium]